MGRPWTPAEERRLRDLWEQRHLSAWAMGRRLGRTAQAVSKKGLSLGLRGGRHGLVSTYQIAADTGYSVDTIRAVCKALGIALRPVPAVALRGGQQGRRAKPRKGLEEEDVPRILAYLTGHREGAIIVRPGLVRYPVGVWGVGSLPPACLGCGRSDRPRKAKGRCSRCCDATRRQRAPDPSSGSGTVGP